MALQYFLVLSLLACTATSDLATNNDHSTDIITENNNDTNKTENKSTDYQTRRRVNWFHPGAGWPTPSTDDLNITQWIMRHRGALTGLFPCCSCWGVFPNGTFYNTGRCLGATGTNTLNNDTTADMFKRVTKFALAAGLTIEPTGAFPVDYIMSERWMVPGAIESAVDLVQREGWTGLGVDNENYPPSMPATMPAKFAMLLANLSTAFDKAGLTLVADVCSTWSGAIGGPEYLPLYHKASPLSLRFMDMAEYFNKGNPVQKVVNLTHLLPLSVIAPAVGMTELAGHANASCGGWPQCANISNPACGCLDYGWNHSAFSAFIRGVEALGVTEIDVYRQDMTPPPGTTAAVPDWWITELQGFLSRG